MRLLVLTTSFPSTVYPHSGIFVRRLLERLPEDIRVTILTPALDRTGEFSARGNRIKIGGVCYAPRAWQTLAHGEGGIPVALRRRPWQWVLVPIFCMAMLVQTLRLARQVDLIHAHWSMCGVIAGLAGRLTGTPVVTTLRGEDVTQADISVLFRKAVRWCGLLNDRIVTVGQAMAEKVDRWVSTRGVQVAVIPNGVGAAFETMAPMTKGRRFMVATIGNLIDRKRVDSVVGAFALFSVNAPSAKLVVVGDGPRRGALEAMVRNLGQSGRVIFTGAIPPDAVPELLSRCSALVLASRSEGRPNVVLEAMAAGVPVVASDIDGVREMIVHGERGLLFPVGDERQSADHLRRLMDEPDLARRLAANARQWVVDQGLTWENAAQCYAELYREVIRRHQP